MSNKNESAQILQGIQQIAESLEKISRILEAKTPQTFEEKRSAELAVMIERARAVHGDRRMNKMASVEKELLENGHVELSSAQGWEPGWLSKLEWPGCSVCQGGNRFDSEWCGCRYRVFVSELVRDEYHKKFKVRAADQRAKRARTSSSTIAEE